MEAVWFSKDSQTDRKTLLDLSIQVTLRSNACQILSYMAAFQHYHFRREFQVQL